MRYEQAPPDQLQLLLQRLVGAQEQVVFALELCAELALRGERCLQLDDATAGRARVVERRRAVAHVGFLSGTDRAVDPADEKSISA
jgi:hypothetical protein